jgi:hypothetical protein
MRISRPFVLGILFTGMVAIAGLTAPVDAWAVDVLRTDLLLWTNAIRGTGASSLTLASPWTERRVQSYMKTAREQFRPAGPLARESFAAWEEEDFLGAAGQGRASTRPKAHKRFKKVCCSVCCLY